MFSYGAGGNLPECIGTVHSCTLDNCGVALHYDGMRSGIFLAVLLAAAALTARADEKFPVLRLDGETYTNVTVTKVTATDVYFFHNGGMGNVKLKKLPPDLQKHFQYDSGKAAAAENQQAANNAKFQGQLQRQPAAHPAPDVRESTPAAGQPATAAVWRMDYSGALSQARSENKLVLLDFTGSDWCPWCIKFDHEVLSTPKFAAYAGNRLELVKVDFPHNTPLPEPQRKANDALARQFGVDSYPTYVLVNADGKEIGRQSGYQEGGPNAFIAELEKFAGR